MGRPKKDLSTTAAKIDIESEQGDIHQDIYDNYADFIVNGKTLLDEKEIVVSISPAINIGLNGGIPVGTWTIINADQKFGKSTVSLKAAVKFQQNKDLQKVSRTGTVKVFYNDLENRLKKMNLDSFPELDLDNFHISRSSKGKIFTGEQQLDYIEKCIRNEPGSLHIIDSFSILSTETELTEGIDKQQRTDSNKLVSKFCRRMSQIVRANQCTIIGITWNIANPSGYGASKQEKTPSALLYQHDIKLKGKKLEPWTVGDKRVGQIVTWQVATSALGAPGAEIQTYIRYGKGIDDVAEIVALGLELGLITQKKAWYAINSIPELEDQNYCGFNGVYEFFKENPDHREEILKQIKDLTIGNRGG